MIALLVVLPALLIGSLLWNAFDRDDASGDDNDPEGPIGREGDDTLTGSDGANFLPAGAGDDLVSGLGGTDRIWGYSGNDDLFGGDDDDRVEGGRGDDTISGDAGSDALWGRVEADTLYGGDGGDSLWAGDAPGDAGDTVFGGAGLDRIVANLGDTVTGGANADDFLLNGRGGTGQTVVVTDFNAEEDDLSMDFAGAPDDEVTLEETATGVILRIAGGQSVVMEGVSLETLLANPESLSVAIVGVPTVIGGNGGAQTLTGTDGFDLIRAGGGDDVVSGLGGNDILVGQEGNDDLRGGAGNDRIGGDRGGDTLDGGGGDDSLSDYLGGDTLAGGAGDDRIIARDDTVDAGGDLIDGGAGEDRLVVDLGDTVTGGAGADTIIARLFSGTGDTLTLTDFNPDEDVFGVDFPSQPGDDVTLEETAVGLTLRIAGGPEVVMEGVTLDDILSNPGSLKVAIAGSRIVPRLIGDDDQTLTGDDGFDFFRAGDGDDLVLGGGAPDKLWGEDGNDDLRGEAGNDILAGGEGDDILAGGAGDDNLRDGRGSNTLAGGDGRDRISANDSSWGDDDDITVGGDVVDGGAGDDRILADLGDSVTGGAGEDHIIVTTASGEGDDLTLTDFDPTADRLDVTLTGAPEDEVTLEETATGVILRSAGGPSVVMEGTTLDAILANPESLSVTIQGNLTVPVIQQTGTAGNDTLTTTEGFPSRISGLGGDDTISIGDPFVGVDAGAGSDTVSEGAETFGAGGSVDLGAGDDVANIFGALTDTISGGAGDDSITTTLFDRVILGGDGDDVISEQPNGEAGWSASGIGTLDGGAGDDSITMGDGGTATGGSGTDSFRVLTDNIRDDAVLITDFDPTTETLTIQSNQLDPAAPDAIEIVQDRFSGVTTVSISGQSVVTLTGITDLIALREAITVDGLDNVT